MENKEKGLIHVYCGDGKGKTTAALGLAIRAAGAGKKVIFLQFMKGNETSELQSLSLLPGILVLRSDREFGFYAGMTEEQKKELTQIHESLLQQALERIRAGECDVLILDEVTYAWNWELTDRKLLEELVAHKPEALELVLTGRDPAQFFLERADYVTRMQCVRHPYEKKVAARKGIEF